MKHPILTAFTTGTSALAFLLGTSFAVPDTAAAQGRNVRVMTQNMFMGNVGTITTATPETLPVAVAKFFNDTLATNPKQRAAALAKKIHDNRADLVALQEVSILRKGSGPTPNDPRIPATEVVHDQLQLLREALDGLGDQYEAVAVIPNSDVQSPSTLGFVVRLTDRTAILARVSSNDLKLSNVQVEQFLAQVVSPQVTSRFGWGSVDVDVSDRKFRFVATHLIPVTPPLIDIQKAQASELIQSAQKTDRPVVYAGDFNTVAGSATYQILVNSGRVDAWQQKNPMALCAVGHPLEDRRGCTCCQDEDLHNDTSKLSLRIDLLIVPPNTEIAEMEVVGADPADHASGLWISDHAGLLAILKPPRN